MGFDAVYDYEGGKLDWLAFGLPVEGEDAGEPALGALTVAVPTCGVDDAVDDVAGRLRDGSPWCVVVNEARVVLGRIRRRRLDGAPSGARARDVMENGPSTYRPSVPAAELLDRMREDDFSRALVTDSMGRLIGVVERSALEKVSSPAAQ
jgi:CBS domain-containing protein